MNGNFIIEYTRNKEEAKRLYFNKEFKRTFWMQVLRTILLLPGCAMFAFFFTIALQIALKMENSDIVTYLGTALFTIIFLYPFIKPIFKIHRMVRKHLEELYKTKDIITTICNLDESQFTYRNDYFELTTNWDNLKKLKIDSTNVLFQSITPSIQFILPKDKISQEALSLINLKIIKNV